MKKLLNVFVTLVVIATFLNTVFALNTDENPYNYYLGNSVNDDIKSATKNIWATVVVLVQVASVACIVFAGLRYMFASADQKADLKQGLIYLTIGAILVFGATTIIGFVTEATKEIL